MRTEKGAQQCTGSCGDLQKHADSDVGQTITDVRGRGTRRCGDHRVFFNANIFLYLTYAAIIVVQIGLFSTRWGLRVRAVGEHPTAADTVGIRVLGIRYSNVIMGGLLAGIGGAYLTVGSVGTFSPGMSSGLGYIALAAMIFGRWTPLGATAAALLFGFAGAAESILASINVPIPTYILAMAPYVATIVAVAGLVGRVRAPAADGKPYIKS